MLKINDAQVIFIAHQLMQSAAKSGELVTDLEGAIAAARAGNLGGALLGFAALVRAIANACIEPGAEINTGAVTLTGDLTGATVSGDLTGLAERESLR